jgi:hypothetical protein
VKKSIVYFCLLFLFLSSVNQVGAGAWTQKRAQGFYKLSFRLIRADRFYEPTGNKIDIPTLSDYTTTFYGEYGVTDWLTLVANVPVFKRITLNKQVGSNSGFVFFEGDSKSGVADSEVGVRFGLLRGGGSVLSIEVLFGLPIGDDSQTNGLLTGDGEFNQLIKAQFGHSFYPVPLYFSGEFGINNRTKGYSDEWYYAAEIGYTFSNKFLVSFKLRGVESRKNGNDTVVGGMGGLFANNQSYLSFGPEVSYIINETFGISAGIESATQAENVLSAPAFSFGIFVKK